MSISPPCWLKLKKLYTKGLHKWNCPVMVKVVFLRLKFVYGELRRAGCWQMAVWASRGWNCMQTECGGGWRQRHRRSTHKKTHAGTGTGRGTTHAAKHRVASEPTAIPAGGTIWQRVAGRPGFLSCGWWDDCQQVCWCPRCQEAGCRAHTNTQRNQRGGKHEGENRKQRQTLGSEHMLDETHSAPVVCASTALQL